MKKNVIVGILLSMLLLILIFKGLTADNSAEKEETTTEAAVRRIPPKGMSSDLFSNQFAINEHIFTLPCPVSDFSVAGFAPKDPKPGPAYRLQAGYEVKSHIIAENKDWFYLYMYNETDQELQDVDCMVGMVILESQYLDHEGIFISNGLTFGASIEEVKKIYGDPQSERVDFSDRTCLKYYETSDENTNTVYFAFGANGLDEISIISEPYSIFSTRY